MSFAAGSDREIRAGPWRLLRSAFEDDDIEPCGGFECEAESAADLSSRARERFARQVCGP